MAPEKYSIIVDTNFLGDYKKDNLICSNFNYLSISRQLFLSLIKFLQNNFLSGSVRVVVPKVVFEELKRQQEKSYVTELNKLRSTFSKFGKLPGFKLETQDFDYGKHLDDKNEAFISKYGIIQLDYPNNLILPKLISKVLSREKPFYKKRSDKDSGFKDALIWESILDYAVKNKDQKIILLTKDPDFRDAKLLDEIKAKTGKEVKIIDNLTEIKTFLDETQKLNLYLRFIENSFNQMFRETLYGVLRQNFYGIELGGEPFRIRDFRVGDELVDIRVSNKNIYELYVIISIGHETYYTGYGVVDDMYKPYEEDEHSGVAVLSVEKTRENKLLLTDIRFEGVKLIGNNKINKVSLT